MNPKYYSANSRTKKFSRRRATDDGIFFCNARTTIWSDYIRFLKLGPDSCRSKDFQPQFTIVCIILTRVKLPIHTLKYLDKAELNKPLLYSLDNRSIWSWKAVHLFIFFFISVNHTTVLLTHALSFLTIISIKLATVCKYVRDFHFRFKLHLDDDWLNISTRGI